MLHLSPDGSEEVLGPEVRKLAVGAKDDPKRGVRSVKLGNGASAKRRREVVELGRREKVLVRTSTTRE